MMDCVRRARTLTLVAAPLTVMLAACGGQDAASGDAAGGRVTVIAGFYPLAYVAEQVGGDHALVRDLTNPGVEPHDLELTPRQVGQIADADLVIYLSGFQPAVDDAVKQNASTRSLDVRDAVPLNLQAEGDQSGGGHEADPHIWLDPTKLATVATAVARAYAEIDPTDAATYQARASDLAQRLHALDTDYAQGLATCARREFVTSHAAFGYLAARYDLEQIPISGVSPEAEPSPARIQEIQRAVEERGITTIFFETLVSPDLAEAIARDTGASTAVLDPIEGIKDPAHEDYFTVMKANLGALRKALSCT